MKTGGPRAPTGYTYPLCDGPSLWLGGPGTVSLNTPFSLPLSLLPPPYHALALISLSLSLRAVRQQRLPPESNHSHVAIASTTTKTHRTQTPSHSYSSLPSLLPVTWTRSGGTGARASCGDELAAVVARTSWPRLAVA